MCNNEYIIRSGTVLGGLLLFIWANQCGAETLFTKCNKEDQSLDECMKKSAQAFLPVLGKGVRSKRLIPLDPLEVPHLDLGQDSGPVNLKFSFSNATILGLSQSKIDKIRVRKNNDFAIELVIPRFELSGPYVGNGKILLLPIYGDGFGNITTQNMNLNVSFSCGHFTKKGIDYLSVKNIKLGFKLDKSHLSFSNMFGGNKELGDAMNTFLNTNSNLIVEEMRGTLEAVFGELIKQVTNSFFHNFPSDQLYKKN